MSCSKENDNQEEIAKGEAAVAWIKSQITDQTGLLIFIPTDEEDTYVFGVDNRQIAHSICETLLEIEFDGNAYNYQLPADKGRVIIHTEETEGIYYKLDFHVKDIPAFQLYLAHPEVIHNENVFARPSTICYYHICLHCNAYYLSKPNRCGKCGCLEFKLCVSGGMI